jgi:hypothetical protein
MWTVCQPHEQTPTTDVQTSPVPRGLQVGAVHALQTWLQNIKHKPADQPAIKHAKTMPYLRVASAEPPWLDKTHFEKKVYTCKMFCEIL